MTSSILTWLQPALTPGAIWSFLGALVAGLAAFHRLMRGKASKEDLAAVRVEVRELAMQLQKTHYDLAQALGSLNAVHRRLDEQGRMLEANTAATLDIAKAVGARSER